MTTFKSIIKMILMLSCFISNIYSSQLYDEIDFKKIQMLVESGGETSKKEIMEQLKKISTDALFKTSEDASIANNRIIMFKLVGTELLRRTKQQIVDVKKYLYQLNREDINTEYEYLLLWVINSSYKAYSSVELIQLFEVTTQSIKLPQRSFEQKLMAIVTSNTILGELIVANQISKRKISEYSYLLNSIMMDKGENSEIRRAAIKGIQQLDFKESTGNLIVLVSDKSIIYDSPLGRSVCIALAHFKVMSALPHIGYILTNTGDEYIFASAAIALGNLGGKQSLKLLIDNENRFSGDYCGVAVRNMDDLVFKILSSNSSEMLPYAVKGTKYLYDGYQKNPKDQNTNQSLKGVNLYKPLLISLLRKTNDKKLIKLILQRLTQIINKQDAKIILEIIPRDAIYVDEWNFINNFIKMKQVKGKKSKVPTDESSRNNTETQEYGDPGYRDNHFTWSWLTNWLGHTGLSAGIDAENNIRIIEVGGINPNVVRHNYWSSMQGADDYWGANTLNNRDMTFSERRNVMSTAVELLQYNIGYPALPTLDALRHISNPGTYVSPSEITDLRCDGLIEYCYEWNNYWVWGATGNHESWESDVYYDISRTSYVSEHNDFYANSNGDPDTELAPIVQGGYAGGSSTHMNWEAQTDVPTYSTDYTKNGTSITLRITAFDRSGIHYIKYKEADEDNYHSSPVQPQHPTSASYMCEFNFNMTEPGWVFYYAVDNGGNSPEFADMIYIEFDPVTISGYVRDSNNNGISGVTINFSNNGGTATTNSNGYYSESVYYGWSGTATPALTGWSFDPPNYPYSNLTVNQVDQDYDGSLNAVSISGLIRDGSNNGINGVTVTFSNSGGTATTNSTGYYSESVDYGWSGTATPSLTGWSFEPDNIPYTNLIVNQVDQDYIGIYTSDPSVIHIPNDYATIQEGVDAASDGNTVLVSAGEYFENVVILNKSINLIGEDAESTIINAGGVAKGVFVKASYNIETIGSIQGFTVENSGIDYTDNVGNAGVVILTHGFGHWTISNNIIKDNPRNGIVIFDNGIVTNNIIRANNNYGIFVSSESNELIINNTIVNNTIGIYGFPDADSVYIANNIIVNNTYYGLLLNCNHFVAYNDLWGNPSGNLYDNGLGNILSDPLFINPLLHDFHLSSSSPCIDTGHPDQLYNDVDGTRNDMGSFGGPYGISYEYPELPVTISGYVSDSNNNGINGVTITFSNGGGTASTGETGYYEVEIDYGWSGTGTPNLIDWSFDPPNYTYSSLIIDQINQDYEGILSGDNDNWELVYQMPRGNSLNDIVALDIDHAVAVGENGEVLNTLDGGENWVSQYSNTSNFLNSVHGFSNNVWGVGNNGTIIHSNDFGNTWIEQSSNTSYDLKSVSFINSTTGWVVGFGGIILHTNDSGNNWIIQESNSNETLNNIMLFNENSGWCVGENGIILHTQDGGNNWVIQQGNITDDLYDICAVNESVGLTIAYYGRKILKTTDAGINWTEISTAPNRMWKALHFITEDEGTLVSSTGLLYHTINGGVSWNWFNVSDNGNVRNLYYLNSDIGWCVGGLNGTFVAKRLSWDNWELQKNDTRIPLNGIFFTNENEGWAVGGNYFNHGTNSPDVILHTNDGGFSWEKQIDILGYGIYDIYFLNSLHGYAVSGNGVYTTTNGGESWDYNNITNYGLISISFTNENVGYISGAYNKIYKTNDGGSTWNYISTNVGNTYFQSINFIDEYNGWASGYGLPSPFTSKIIHTSDGGNTWDIQYNDLGGRTWIHFIDLWNGWAVTKAGKVLHTGDGGGNWNEQISNVSVDLRDVYFINTEIGYAVGDNGTIISTSDGGNTWTQDSNFSDESLYSVFALNSGNIWATGNNGIILKKVTFLDIGKDDISNLKPKSFIVYPNYPNPFNPVTTLRYDLPERSDVMLSIYDILGRQVKIIVQDVQEPGFKSVVWDGRNNLGETVSAGVYLYQIKAGDFVQTRKMILLK